MKGTEVTTDRGPPVHIIACSPSTPTACSSPEFVCVPAEPNFPACVMKSGEQLCPAAYPDSHLVTDTAGERLTVCCTEPPQIG